MKKKERRNEVALLEANLLSNDANHEGDCPSGTDTSPLSTPKKNNAEGMRYRPYCIQLLTHNWITIRLEDTRYKISLCHSFVINPFLSRL